MASKNKQKSRDDQNRHSYQKYRCQYKQKSILTKLNNDSGYPQNILSASLPISPQENNYVEANKKNLKNFFKQRIPAQNILLNKLMKRQSELINPKKIFEIKKLQYQLKAKTKINLQKQFQSELQNLKKSSFSKASKSFVVNDKNRELKLKYGGKMSLSFYEDQNYRRGTQSHIGKRSKIMKKQAYDKVFGPDISSQSRVIALTQPLEPDIPFRAKSTSLNASYSNLKQRNKLKDLIQKMKDYKNQLQGNKVEHLPQRDDRGEEEEKDYESNLITMIRKMTKEYQQQNIDQGYQQIEKLEDIAKISKQYYFNMQKHKQHRLQKRMKLVNQTIILSNLQNTYIPPQFNLALEMREQSLASCENQNGQIIQQPQSMEMSLEGPIHSVKNWFKLLRKTLVKWAALYYIYGIERSSIFLAFRAKRQPYEMQGSYVLFKCIKMGDFDSVRNFIINNKNYIFEIDISGKAPLAYACAHGRVDIARFIIQQGVNCDHRCSNGRTPLFYALRTRNIGLVRLLLQHGASPWSNSQNPYSQMIAGENEEEIQILLNNARKIYLGMQLQKSIQLRREFWSRKKSDIYQGKRLSYQA